MIDKIYNNIKNNFYITDNIRNIEIIKYKKSLSVKNPDKKITYKKFENLSVSDLQTINYSKKI